MWPSVAKECIVQLGYLERPEDFDSEEEWEPSLEELRGLPVVICPQPAWPLLDKIGKVRRGEAAAAHVVRGFCSHSCCPSVLCMCMQLPLCSPGSGAQRISSPAATAPPTCCWMLSTMHWPASGLQELGQVGTDGPDDPFRMLNTWHSYKGHDIIEK